ncbi:MAG: hypothetical protein F9K34_03060 [Albidovulum sp.]|uniref:PEP-CTERM sorting domain-containing protein n=1 Tax=Albidovulum sp. TaxID=1872424 RepID=UPI001324A172|nr:PEP-CTERM sorting domain-containing protein [Defluviimonas sp.]KAB2886239.1 MAG: hypothetical protein F9K34_03060 [Defluviimonas sp.]
MVIRSLRTAALLAGSVVAGLAEPASARTVTFDYLSPAYYDSHGGLDLPYVENGVTVTSTDPFGGILSEFTMAGALHIDDAPAGFTEGVIFTTGSTFDVLGFSFVSLGFAFFDEAPTVTGSILIRGFLDGVQVVRDHVTMSPVFGTAQDIVLDSAFAGLDAFSIELIYPDTRANCDAPCGHIELDSISFGGIAPVPLPASGLLLGAGVLAIAAWRRRRG